MTISAQGNADVFHRIGRLSMKPIIIGAVIGGLIVAWIGMTVMSAGISQPSESVEPTQQAAAKEVPTAEIFAELYKEESPSIPETTPKPPASTPSQTEQRSTEAHNSAPVISKFEQARRDLIEQEKIRILQFKLQQQHASLIADTSIEVIPYAQSADKPVNASPDVRLQQATDEQLASVQRLKNTSMDTNIGGEGQTDVNNQQYKERFAAMARGDDYLQQSRLQAISPYEIKVGTIIPATLISGLNSDLPGQVIAQVSQNVYDSATGRYLLIPQGAKLYGIYDSRISYGQARAQSAWTRINYPDGSTLNLAGMGGIDVEGFSGFEDQVDNHYMKIFGNAALLGMISGVAQAGISEDSRNSDTKSAIADGVTQQFANTGSSLIQKNLDVQPTIVIRSGYKFNIMVNKDILLSPYSRP